MDQELLDSTLPTIRAIADAEAMPVVYPNLTLKKSLDDDHFRLNVLDTDPVPYIVTGGSINTLILQVGIYTREGSGTVKTNRILKSLRAAFKMGTIFKIDGMQFTCMSDIFKGPSMQSDAWYFVPVQIRFSLIN